MMQLWRRKAVFFDIRKQIVERHISIKKKEKEVAINRIYIYICAHLMCDVHYDLLTNMKAD
jgi:hypothetical protein